MPQQRGSEATASRVEAVTGAWEQVEFAGGDERLFLSLHLPSGPARGAVLVCSPVASELERNYRRESLLAWNLAARGIAVGRFHYRGAGHSDGETSSISLETMLEDALLAAERLEDRAESGRLAFVGTRLAAFVAASVARRNPSAPLALWEPAGDGERYFREVLRAGFVSDLRQGATSPPSHEAAVGRLEAEGWIDIAGHTVGWPLYESARGRSLLDEVGNEPRPVLVVQLSHSAKVGPAYRSLAEELERRGFGVDIRVIDEVEPWWLARDRRGKAALAEITAQWLDARLGELTLS